MFRKPGILFSSFSHKATNLFPNILVTNTPVVSNINNTNIIPDPGIVASKLNIASGRYFCGTRLLINSKKNLITITLKIRGIQKRRPDIR
jgi:hypothetical protein